MDNIFNESMSSNEARLAFFRAIDGKNEEEIESIKKEYAEILPAISARETELYKQGWIID